MTANALLVKHMAAREALLTQERAIRFDAEALASLTDAERAAEAKIRRIRAEEHISIWQTEDEKPQLFPGMHFLTSKALIEETQLYKLLKRMPVSAVHAVPRDRRYFLGSPIDPCNFFNLPGHRKERFFM